MENLLSRFLRYVSIDTKSDDTSESYPSTQKQFNLAKLLVEELTRMGLSDISLDEHCYVMATLPANTEKKIPVIGLVAHMDTAPDMSGENVRPRIIKNYDGSDILLNKDLNLILSPSEFPELLCYKGQTIITTDGTTLLGADDKAGITAIMEALQYLVNHPEMKHGAIRVGFTPDEEIGRGVDKFDVKKFNADFGYTIDGGRVGEIEFENFNAAMAKITIQGRNIHPGYAKDKMINSILVATELNDMLPVNERPEFTTGYEGFFHIVKFEGTVEKTFIQYIIRDHDRAKFEKKKELMQQVVGFMNKKYRENTVVLDLKEQYLNMREMVEPQYHIVQTAIDAMMRTGVTPVVVPIRGGTDGARLSYMGLPCPNLFAGGHNFHGKMEYLPLESLQKSVETIVKIIEIYSGV